MTVLEQAKAIRASMDNAGAMMTDEQAAGSVYLFMPWEETTHYTADERVRYGEQLYKCLQEHDAQAAWTPDAAPSLWVRIDDPAVEWPEWVKPTGATDAYPLGAKVSHNGKRWVSEYKDNVWEPGVYGWTEVNADGS